MSLESLRAVKPSVDPMIHMTCGNPRKDHRAYPTEAPSIHPSNQGMRMDGPQGIVIG